MTHTASSSPRAVWSARQRGASMIEVLVAILIVSLGILALAGLLGVSSRLGKTSEFRAIAAQLASDMADRMRANRPGADEGAYALASTDLASDTTSAAGACASATACTAAEIAAIDKAEWQATLFGSLPSGTGYIDYTGGTGVADIWVIWRDPDAVAVGDNADNTLINANSNNRCPDQFDESNSPSCMFFRVGL